VRRVVQRLSGERGVALVVAMMVMAALTVSSTTVIYSATQSQHESHSLRSRDVAFRLAETGLNSAVALLGGAQTSGLDPAIMSSSEPSGSGTAASGGSYKYWGTLDTTTSTWRIYGKGIVANPNSPGGTLTHTLSASVPMVPNPTQPQNATAWNYMISTATSNATTCDMSLANSVLLSESLYVAGNLCLNNTSSIQETDATKPVSLMVAGKLALQGSNGVGLNSGNPITNAAIGGGCTSNIGSAGHLCNPASPTNDKVWARTLTSSVTPLTIPVADYDGYYNDAKPGPMHPCNVTSGTPPTWDNNGSLNLTTYPNGSVPTSFNLTPATSYTCRYVEPSGYVSGQLDWNATTKTLSIKGVMYIDGSAYTSNGVTNLYSGSGTLYLSGTFTMQTSTTKICGITAGATCSFSTWTPNSNMFILVAQGNSGGKSIMMSQTTMWQGGFFAKNAIDLGNASSVEGPMIASTILATNSVQVKPLPYITTLPLGAPGNPNTHASPEPPSGYSG
jgi:Tfp pilus assembly protein PilX